MNPMKHNHGIYAVMQRLGMKIPDNTDHPAFLSTAPLKLFADSIRPSELFDRIYPLPIRNTLVIFSANQHALNGHGD